MAPLTAEGDRWLELVRAAERDVASGSLGPFEVLGEVAEGGQGLVFRARQPGTDRIVALKRLARGVYSTPSMRRRFEREVELVSGLTHPGIVTVYGVEEVDGLPCLAMEWVEGEPLTEWSARLPADRRGIVQRLQSFLEICDAVQFAHQNGVIHRDLKPGNILIDASGRPRVLDFGLARRVDGAEAGEVTQTVGFVGTPAYAAPEHFTEGEAPLDVRSDVYSLGVVLYEVLAGARPFSSSKIESLIREIEAGQPPRLSRRGAAVGRDLDLVVRKAMAAERADRYPTVHALSEDLRRYRDGRPVTAVPPSVLYSLGKWTRRNRVVAALSAAVVVLILGAVAGGWRQMQVIAAERDHAEQQRGLAESARVRAVEAMQTARAETEKTRAITVFYLDSIHQAATAWNRVGSTDVVDVLEHATEAMGSLFGDHPEVALELQAQLARTFMFMGRYEQASRMVEEGLARAALLDEPDLYSVGVLRQSQADLASHRGDLETGLASIELALQALRALADDRDARISLTAALSARAMFLQRVGRLDEAVENLRECIAVGERWSTEHSVLVTVASLGAVLAEQGELEQALALLESGMERAEEVVERPDDILIGRLSRSLAITYTRLQRFADAVPHARRSAEVREAVYPREHPSLVAAQLFLGECLLQADRTGEALDHYGRLAGARGGEAGAARFRRLEASCWVRLEELDAASETYARAWSQFEQHVPAGDRERPELLLEWADVERRRGRVAETRDLYERACAEWVAAERAGRAPSGTYAGLLRSLGRGLGAVALADEALESAASD